MHELNDVDLIKIAGGLDDPSGEWEDGEIGYDIGCTLANIAAEMRHHHDICDG
ncbi:bacteriocin-type signal sequence [Levilactobacillus cerevisiae]|uniref:bacteriocin-type signal sequence n=1 Tax=Levilactobacillus cerevisiae TaxID=1704076 RepID=UPI000F79B4AD|nr:bacteriocin-type signal sequence [Levilactobacillus cerevisiae]